MSTSINSSERINKLVKPRTQVAETTQGLVDVDLRRPSIDGNKVKLTFENIIYEVKIMCSKKEE